MEDGTSGLPTKEEDEFRPFVRRLPEFKFWHSATRAVALGFVCSFFTAFDLPVFWPVLVVYWLILFVLTSKSLSLLVLTQEGRWLTTVNYSEEADPAYDQIPLCSIHRWQDSILSWQMKAAALFDLSTLTRCSPDRSFFQKSAREITGPWAIL
jgi:Rer1 family